MMHGRWKSDVTYPQAWAGRDPVYSASNGEITYDFEPSVILQP